MSNLNHRRPRFKVADAGGGERVRTISEELRAAQVPSSAQPPRPRCGACGSRNQVTGHLELRCAACRVQAQRSRALRREEGDVERSARPRSRICPTCHTELPVTGTCGFCD